MVENEASCPPSRWRTTVLISALLLASLIVVVAVVVVALAPQPDTVNTGEFGRLETCHCATGNLAQKGRIWLEAAVLSLSRRPISAIGIEALTVGHAAFGTPFLVDNAHAPSGAAGMGAWTTPSMPIELRTVNRIRLGSARLLPGHSYSVVVDYGLATAVPMGGFSELRITLQSGHSVLTKLIDAQSFLCNRSHHVPTVDACIQFGRRVLRDPSGWTQVR